MRSGAILRPVDKIMSRVHSLFGITVDRRLIKPVIKYGSKTHGHVVRD
jgi:hypothetical protein